MRHLFPLKAFPLQVCWEVHLNCLTQSIFWKKGYSWQNDFWLFLSDNYSINFLPAYSMEPTWWCMYEKSHSKTDHILVISWYLLGETISPISLGPGQMITGHAIKNLEWLVTWSQTSYITFLSSPMEGKSYIGDSNFFLVAFLSCIFYLSHSYNPV